MTPLLDANVLIALTITEHEHRVRAERWMAAVDGFALCPIVEGALIRFVVRLGDPAPVALHLLAEIHADPRCTFWPDDASYTTLRLDHVRGHRQVTDAYLVGLAARRGSRLATFDHALATEYGDLVELVA